MSFDKDSWFGVGGVLKEEMLAYNWQYRLKICSKCPIDTQKRLECKRFDNFRTIKGYRIQETHCKKLIKARSAKFRSRIESFLRLSPFGQRSTN